MVSIDTASHSRIQGRNGIDNGWIQFNNVRVPRENMLAKWAQVSPEVRELGHEVISEG